MPIQLQTSFVPKRPAMMASAARRSRFVSVFGALAIGVFMVVAALAAVVFFYHRYLVSEITDMDVLLAAAKRSFEPEFVDIASRLNQRIESAKALLSAHRSLSPLFDLFEKKTLESVRFQNFTFTAEKGKTATLLMVGQAKSFNAVALQSDIFGEEKYFKNPVFSNFTLDERGDVIFQFKTAVDEALLRYRESVIGAAARGGAGATTSPIGADE